MPWAVMGPTATGKTEVCLALAELCTEPAIEILSCDSVQIYRGFDVGSAKASPAQRSQAIHHGIDVADAKDPFDAMTYCSLADKARVEAQSRGHRLLLCGGTGLYLRALRFGLIDTPPADAALRQSLEAQEDTKPGYLHQRLLECDPKSAARISANNRHHLLRALEICITSGRPASALRAEHGFGVVRRKMAVVVVDRDSKELRAKIQTRSQKMLQAGLLDEVAALLQQGVPKDCRPMRAVGYRQAVAVLEGEACRTQLGEAIATATWQYVRRQRTWFRKEPHAIRITLGDDAIADAHKILAVCKKAEAYDGILPQTPAV